MSATKKGDQRSHGESFLAIAQDQFKPNGVYLLDEPEAALSPQRQLTLLLDIASCAKEAGAKQGVLQRALSQRAGEICEHQGTCRAGRSAGNRAFGRV